MFFIAFNVTARNQRGLDFDFNTNFLFFKAILVISPQNLVSVLQVLYRQNWQITNPVILVADIKCVPTIVPLA